MLRNNRGIPAFDKNAVLKLIIACGTGYVAFHLTRVTLMVAEADPSVFTNLFEANWALPPVASFPEKAWTLLTYGWAHHGFWILFSNMIWLYAFGSLVQMLIGHKQVIPIFFYCLLAGGIFYEAAQLIPGAYFHGRTAMLGAQAGVTGLAVAALTLSPGYKFYLSETMRIPLSVVAIIFFVLQLLNANINYEGAPLMMLIGGALMGYGYIILLRNGTDLGGWVYNLGNKVNDRFEQADKAYASRTNTRRHKTISMYSPKPKQGITQNKIDEILDKINQKGYDSLSKEDKETLIKASGNKENN